MFAEHVHLYHSHPWLVFLDCFVGSATGYSLRQEFRYGSEGSVRVVVKVWIFCDHSVVGFGTISVESVSFASNE